MKDWYEDNVEDGVRDVVRLLRDNGWNTTCSCHHDMEIECICIPDNDYLWRLDQLLYTYFAGRHEPIDYDIQYQHLRRSGVTLLCNLTVRLHNRDKRARL